MCLHKNQKKLVYITKYTQDGEGRVQPVLCLLLKQTLEKLLIGTPISKYTYTTPKLFYTYQYNNMLRHK